MPAIIIVPFSFACCLNSEIISSRSVAFTQDASSGNIIISAPAFFAVLRHFLIFSAYVLYGESITGSSVAVSVVSGMFIWNWHIFTVAALSPDGFASICFTVGSSLDMAGGMAIVLSSMITALLMIVRGFIIVFLLFFICANVLFF